MTTFHKSRYTIDIPNIDLLSYIFSSGDKKFRQKPLYYDAHQPHRCYSLAEGEVLAKRVGKGLQNLGIKENDKVVLYSGNNLYFPVLLWGVIASGGIFSAVSQTASVGELETQLKDLGASILLTGIDGAETAKKAAASADIPQSRVLIFCDPEDSDTLCTQTDLQPWTSFWASSRDVESWSWKKSQDPTYLVNKTVVINYSSGTTGTPKGVEITHANIVANSSQLVFVRTLWNPNDPVSVARHERLGRSGERWLAPLPMYHAYGQIYYCVNAPRTQAKVFVMRSYTITSLLHYLDIYRITLLTGVPTILIQLSKQPPGKYNLNSLEYALTGSAPLGPATGQLIERDFLPPGLPLKQGWGMTETTNSISGFSPDDKNVPESVGFLNPNCEAKVVPVEGQDWKEDIPTGAVAGELLVYGANIMKGYHNRPQQTEETLLREDGKKWLRTGDVAYLDTEGRIYIIDRLKALIKVKGLQVSPAELEAAILLHPGVADVSVVGAKTPDGAEYPRAFVVKKDEGITAREVFNIISGKFSKHKHLTGGVFFIDEIPKTGSGKVMKRMLPDYPLRLSKM
ncbi:related to 4-coumarate--CoA ligase [Ramularia collo-cygni]|uniref:Related to 4-coumarate--CoA ligase n=1 Tax=Ramularia collo-cygni TaxID=112498 RepID=A0A2D3ULD8_9PEZI|nr:related to 4-coumarate--CoA ligase [Ramularia collo-cygni]CZT14612.1 related to 4-coumarate--CoA ligase [Ramularia collo-cygni]